LFRRAYWRRIWIIQEILLAQELIVICGSVQFQWTPLEALSAEISRTDVSQIHEIKALARGIGSQQRSEATISKEIMEELATF
jgi:hypothetical protein